jgi:hypothetical protein
MRVLPVQEEVVFSVRKGEGLAVLLLQRKGGCFDLLMQLENITFKEAVIRMQDIFAGRPDPGAKADGGIDAWLDDLVVLEEGETAEDWAERVRNAIKGKIIENYKAGQKSKAR